MCLCLNNNILLSHLYMYITFSTVPSSWQTLKGLASEWIKMYFNDVICQYSQIIGYTLFNIASSKKKHYRAFVIVPLGWHKMNISPLWNYLHDSLQKKLDFSTLPVFNLYVTVFFSFIKLWDFHNKRKMLLHLMVSLVSQSDNSLNYPPQ